LLRGYAKTAEETDFLGVCLIFFLQGLSLSTGELRGGYRPKRLHLFILFWNYLVFPLLVGVFLVTLAFIVPAEFRLGFALLSILPTTISSAVVFSTISGGNTSNSIFATIVSNACAILLVPLFGFAYLSIEVGLRVSIGPVFTKLFLMIVLPLFIGQLVRHYLSKLASVVSAYSNGLSQGIIVFIIYCAFAESVYTGFFEQLHVTRLFGVVLSVLVLLLLISRCVWWSSALFRFTREQRISAFFCASQKSLVTGLPLAASLLTIAPVSIDRAAILIPLMCYHPAQLILAAFLSDRWSVLAQRVSDS